MIVYGSSLSPFVRKVLVFAQEKGVEVDNVPHHPARPQPDFLEASPFRKIPALRDGDFLLADSTAIVAYFDALQPEPVLIPAEPKARAKTVWYEEFVDTLLMPAGAQVFFNRAVAPLFLGRPGDEDAADKALTETLPSYFDYIEGEIGPSGHLVGEAYTLADIAMASPFATLAHIDVRPDPGRYPKLTAFLASIHARPAFEGFRVVEEQLMAAARERYAANTTQ
jgi:glutathione S-transferase